MEEILLACHFMGYCCTALSLSSEEQRANLPLIDRPCPADRSPRPCPAAPPLPKSRPHLCRSHQRSITSASAHIRGRATGDETRRPTSQQGRAPRRPRRNGQPIINQTNGQRGDPRPSNGWIQGTATG